MRDLFPKSITIFIKTLSMDKDQDKSTNLPDDEQLKKDINLDKDESGKSNANLEKKADSVIDSLLSDDVTEQNKREAVDTMGAKAQIEVTNLSKMLEAPIKKLGKAGSTGGAVADSLVDLKNTVEDLDPARFDLTSPAGFMERLSRFIPFIGKRLSRYFARYMSSEDVIARIVQSMETGKDQLSRDNITLSNDKERMISGMNKLKKNIRLGQLIDQKLSFKLEHELQPEDPKKQFIQNELLFPLRQRIIDLQQTLAVNQQSILTSELIIRNNRELMRGVDRALTVTISALQTAVACALALNNQEIVLKKIEALNETTSKLIASNSERLKQQGAEIQKKATESTLKIQDLEKAFENIKKALIDITQYREDALPKLKDSMERMDKLTDEGFKAIEEVKTKDENKSSDFTIDLDEDDYEILD